MSVRLTAVLCAGSGTIGPEDAPSGIAKTCRPGPMRVEASGIEKDFHGDTRHHGGPEKALHHYPFEHYAFWGELYGPLPLLETPGAFGENLSGLGLDESSVCLGDIYRLGTALLQVSQARQPCWKLNHRLGRPDIARIMQNSGRTGWYYRVLEPGLIAAGDAFLPQERPLPDWPLARLLSLIASASLNPDELRQAVALPLLADSWKRLFARRLETCQVEDWSKRLDG